MMVGEVRLGDSRIGIRGSFLLSEKHRFFVENSSDPNSFSFAVLLTT